MVFAKSSHSSLGGVGVRIRQLGDPPLPTILGAPQPGSPAAETDIESCDRILAIDGQSTSEMSMDEVLDRMRGPIGAPVRLKVARYDDEASREVEITRAMITVESVRGDFHDGRGDWVFRLGEDARIGYLRITTFGDKTVAEVSQHLMAIASREATSPIQALILDVRDNAGGALDAAVEISDLFSTRWANHRDHAGS